MWLCFYLIVKIKVEQNVGCVSYLSTHGAGEAIWTRVQLPAVAIGREEHTCTLNSAARNRKELPIPAAFLPTQTLPLPLQPWAGRSLDPFLCS